MMHRDGERKLMGLMVVLLLQGVFVPVGSAQRKPELSVPSGRWHVKNGNSTRTRWGIDDTASGTFFRTGGFDESIPRFAVGFSEST